MRPKYLPYVKEQRLKRAPGLRPLTDIRGLHDGKLREIGRLVARRPAASIKDAGLLVINARLVSAMLFSYAVDKFFVITAAKKQAVGQPLIIIGPRPMARLPLLGLSPGFRQDSYLLPERGGIQDEIRRSHPPRPGIS